MGVPSTKPMVCNHCGEDDITKLVTKHGNPERICRKCKYAKKKSNQEIENGDEFIIDKIKGYCLNGCNWWRWIEYERGTRPETRLLCPKCKERDNGTISRGGALPDHGHNSNVIEVAA